MTWSIYAKGTKAESIKLVQNASGPGEGQSDYSHFQRAKDHILGELDAANDETDCKVEAWGHADAAGCSEEIKVKVEPKAAEPEPAPSDG